MNPSSFPTPSPYPTYPDGYALLIGISYHHWIEWGERLILDGSERDVSALEAHFLHPQKAAYLRENVRVLKEKEATRERILMELDKLAIETKGNPDASVLIHYSGHGLQAGIAPYDFDIDLYFEEREANAIHPDKWKDSLVEARVFAEKVANIAAKKVMVILDCCHSENIAVTRGMNRFVYFDQDATDEIQKEMERLPIAKGVKQGAGRVILASCGNDEKSIDTGKNGLFTEELLRCLNGAGNIEKKGWVGLLDMMKYIPSAVKERAEKEFGRTQNPVFRKIEDFGTEGFTICAYDIAKTRGLPAIDEIPHLAVPPTVSDDIGILKDAIERLKEELREYLDEEQQNGIAKILDRIKESGCEYDRIKYRTIKNELTPAGLQNNPYGLVQSTESLINDLRPKRP